MKAFERYHPSVLLICFVSVMVTVMFSSNPVFHIVALSGAVAYLIAVNGLGGIGKYVGFYIIMFVLISVTNPLFSHSGATKLFYFNGKPVTLEAFICGIASALMIISVMLWCKCLGKAMSSDRLMYLFGKPFPKFALILSATLRFIPRFKRELGRVSRSQRAMGMYTSNSMSDRVRRYVRIIISITSWAIENSMDTASSMKARGYGSCPRSTFSIYRFSVRDGLLSVIILFLYMPVFASFVKGAAAFNFYPRIDAIDISAGSLTAYIFFGILCHIPFFIELKEMITWKYCVSKI